MLLPPRPVRSLWVRLSLVLLLALVVPGLAGCAMPGRQPDVSLPPRDPVADRQAVLRTLYGQPGADQPERRLRAGDTVGLLFHIRPTAPPAEDDTLAVGDVLRVAVLGEDRSQDRNEDRGEGVEPLTQRIQPDGRLTLPGIGALPAAGRAVADLRTALERLYGALYRWPRVDLAVARAATAEGRFLATVDSRAGPSRTVAVTRDGHLTLPALAPLPVAGRLLTEAEGAVEAAYEAAGLRIGVSLTLEGDRGWRTYVLGEVQKPGVQETARPQTALMAIAAAGGTREEADLTDVRVLSLGGGGEGRAGGKARLDRLNLLEAMERARLEADMVLPDEAVLYVPPSMLAEAGRAADHILRQTLFFEGTFGTIYKVLDPSGIDGAVQVQTP